MTTPTSRHLVVLLSLASALTAGLWFRQVAQIGFLSDDLVQLSDIANDQAPSVWSWFNREYYGFYRPLTAVAWRWQYLAWGMSAEGYRLVNALLHGVCACGVYAIAIGLQQRRWVALVAALLFLFNPGPAAGVLSIAGMTGLLSAALYVLSVAACLRSTTRGDRWQAVSLAAFLLAMLTKETALSLPFVVVALRWLHLGQRPWAALRAASPWLVLLGLYLGLRYVLFGHLAPAAAAQRSLNPFSWLTNLALYGVTPLPPWGLEPVKAFFRGSPVLLGCAAGGLLVGGAVVAIALRRRRGRLPLFAAAWVVLTATPVLGLYSPWNAYLPAVGVCVLLASIAVPCGRDGLAVVRWAGILVWVGLAMLYQIDYARQWVQASALRDRVWAATVGACGQSVSPWALAGVPGELRDVPVFGGAWGMVGAIRLAAVSNAPVVLPAVHLSDAGGGVSATLDTVGVVHLATQREHDFFRLEVLAVLTRDQAPRPGFAYAAGPCSVRVVAVNGQGQPSALTVSFPASGRPSRVLAWDGSRLVAAVAADQPRTDAGASIAAGPGPAAP